MIETNDDVPLPTGRKCLLAYVLSHLTSIQAMHSQLSYIPASRRPIPLAPIHHVDE
jgi:hypothetical protein